MRREEVLEKTVSFKKKDRIITVTVPQTGGTICERYENFRKETELISQNADKWIGFFACEEEAVKAKTEAMEEDFSRFSEEDLRDIYTFCNRYIEDVRSTPGIQGTFYIVYGASGSCMLAAGLWYSLCNDLPLAGKEYFRINPMEFGQEKELDITVRNRAYHMWETITGYGETVSCYFELLREEAPYAISVEIGQEDDGSKELLLEVCRILMTNKSMGCVSRREGEDISLFMLWTNGKGNWKIDSDDGTRILLEKLDDGGIEIMLGENWYGVPKEKLREHIKPVQPLLHKSNVIYLT